jgi:ABC-type phosphate/phosphonate transport system substrate-binding protein
MPARAIHSTPAVRATFCRGRFSAALRVSGVLALGTAALALSASALVAQSETSSQPPIRFGFSRSMFREVNESDARASLKVYAGVIARERNLAADPDPLLYEGRTEIVESLRQGKVDIVAGSSAELLELPADLVTGPYLLSISAQGPGVEYLLLTHTDSGIATLADLKGRRVAVLNSVRGSLATYWLDVLLETRGLGPPRQFLRDLRFVAKPSLAVLPVFFRQLDACVITRESFAIAVEMNPQVGRQLRILATSPLVAPTVTCFRQSFDPKIRARIVDALASIQTSVAGQQMLTIFQAEKVEARDDADLATTRQLLADHARLTAAMEGMPGTADATTR